MILDYLLHQAVTTCIEHAYALPSQDVGRAVAQVDDFLKIFNARHAGYKPDANLHFRHTLLQLLTLSTQRFTHNSTTPPLSSLLALRELNLSRTMDWIETADRIPTSQSDITAFETSLPLSPEILVQNRRTFLISLKLNPEWPALQIYGSEESVTLLDLLPLFMRLTATVQKIHNSEINPEWMRLATQWMQQACLEQYLIYGASGSDAVDEAFAWGYKSNAEEADNLNAMFESSSQTAEEVQGWAECKTRALGALILHGEEDVRSHLARLAEKMSMREFGREVLGFLEALVKSVDEPVLVQLEKGRLQGLSRAETREFLMGCGVQGGTLEGLFEERE